MVRILATADSDGDTDILNSPSVECSICWLHNASWSQQFDPHHNQQLVARCMTCFLAALDINYDAVFYM